MPHPLLLIFFQRVRGTNDSLPSAKVNDLYEGKLPSDLNGTIFSGQVEF